MIDPLHLSALIASRLCHDLISPIGAISNGVELMMMDSAGASSPEMALILESAGHANARIRYFRIAFGQCAPDQRIARGEVMGVISDTAAGGRVKIAWDSPADLHRREVKLAFLALMCLETAMVQGGEIAVTYGDDGWALVAKAPRLRREAALWDGFDTLDGANFDDISAGHVHFALLALEAARQHRSIVVSGGEADGQMTIRF